MKKAVIFALAVAVSLTLLSGQEQYLYWMIGDHPYEDVPFEYAKINVLDTEGNSQGYLCFADAPGQEKFVSNTLEGENPGADGLHLHAPTWAALGEYGTSAYSFLVELYNESDVQVGRSLSTYAYDALADFISKDGWSTTPSGGALSVNVVPEPTSGLLLLLGVAGLALRRRRV